MTTSIALCFTASRPGDDLYEPGGFDEGPCVVRGGNVLRRGPIPELLGLFAGQRELDRARLIEPWRQRVLACRRTMRADGIPAANAFTCRDVLSESAASSRASVAESTPAVGLACGTAKIASAGTGT